MKNSIFRQISTFFQSSNMKGVLKIFQICFQLFLDKRWLLTDLKKLMVMTMQVRCTQIALCIHKNLCAPFIPLSQDNLNLLLSFFFALCLAASSYCPLAASSYCPSLPCCTLLIFLYVCFHRSQICRPAINQTPPS